MIRTFIQYLIIDLGINLMFDNIKNNFTVTKHARLDIPSKLISGCRCEVCIMEGTNLPVGARVTGSWVNLIFNGLDGDNFYFMTDSGEWVDLHVDNIAMIIVEDEISTQVMQNNMWDFNNED